MRRSTLLLIACATLTGTACGSGQRVVADVDDYAQYRRVKLETSFERRLTEGWRYLRRHPEGTFRDEVRSWFETAEERYRRQAWDSAPKLRTYVKSIPDGPHTPSVRARIAWLEQRAQAVVDEERDFLIRERERQQRFDAAARHRAEFQQLALTWVRVLSATPAFGRTATEWEPELSTAFFEREPPGSCDGATCEKVEPYAFEVPSPRGLEERRANFSVLLNLDAEGRLVGASLTGHALFDGLAEASRLERVEIGDLLARAEAIGTAVQIASVALEARFPHDRCSQEAVSPTVLLRHCDGRRVELIAAEAIGEADRIEVRLMP